MKWKIKTSGEKLPEFRNTLNKTASQMLHWTKLDCIFPSRKICLLSMHFMYLYCFPDDQNKRMSSLYWNNNWCYKNIAQHNFHFELKYIDLMMNSYYIIYIQIALITGFLNPTLYICNNEAFWISILFLPSPPFVNFFMRWFAHNTPLHITMRFPSTDASYPFSWPINGDYTM